MTTKLRQGSPATGQGGRSRAGGKRGKPARQAKSPVKQTQRARSKNDPPHHGYVMFGHKVKGVPHLVSETMGCAFLQKLDQDHFLVALNNDSVVKSSFTKGTLFVVCWDGKTVHGMTGRPLACAVQRRRSSPKVATPNNGKNGRRKPKAVLSSTQN